MLPQSIADLESCHVSLKKWQEKAEFWHYQQEIMEALLRHLSENELLEVRRACARDPILKDAELSIAGTEALTVVALKRDDYYRRATAMWRQCQRVKRNVQAFKATPYYARVARRAPKFEKAAVQRNSPYELIASLLTSRVLNEIESEEIKSLKEVTDDVTNKMNKLLEVLQERSDAADAAAADADADAADAADSDADSDAAAAADEADGSHLTTEQLMCAYLESVESFEADAETAEKSALL